ncbi:MAG TPA: hypothetical protein VHD76_19715 [Bryobacteraceae bacterium]|jgi:hypothetical protein|nr:hypothetical protein [Bryobacteraceae bacterium]
MSVRKLLLTLLLPSLGFCADETQLLQKILQRLDRLEEQNQQLTDEVRSLREQLAATSGAAAAPAAPKETGARLEERTAALEQRTADLDQVKVEASQKFPIRLTGMALFNSFLNGANNGGSQNPEVAALTPGPSTSGASFHQTTLGLLFFGPQVAGAKVSGRVDADFYGSYSGSIGQIVRLRTAAVNVDWKNQSVSLGVEAPLISPRSPNSLAEVGAPPLSGAGNLWLWQPQFRVEQRFSLGDTTGIRAQGALYETNETGYLAASDDNQTIEKARPGYEGRVELWTHPSGGSRYEIASGFHLSTSHSGGWSIPSRVYTVDWLISPWSKLEWTGTYFTGRNLTGIGGIGPGYRVRYDSDSGGVYVSPVHSTGGWTQLSYLATSRLTFNAFAGEQANRAADLRSGAIGRNFSYAVNAMYRLTPNILTGIEAMQIRTNYLGAGTRLQNRYDLALAYLF